MAATAVAIVELTAAITAVWVSEAQNSGSASTVPKALNDVWWTRLDQVTASGEGVIADRASANIGRISVGMRNSVTSARAAPRHRPSGSLAGRKAFPVTVAQRA